MLIRAGTSRSPGGAAERRSGSVSAPSAHRLTSCTRTALPEGTQGAARCNTRLPGTAELVPLLQIALQDRCAHRTRTMVQVARPVSLIFLRRAVPDVRNDLSWAATGMSDRMSRG